VTVPAAISLVTLPPAALKALLADDLAAAGRVVGLALPESFRQDGALWRLRLDQIAEDPSAAPWLVRAVVAPGGVVVGHAGFHGPPDERGMVEVGYWIVAEHRRRGYGAAALGGLMAYAAQEGAQVVRASIAPANTASQALVGGFGFVHVGEQWDEEDGRELVFERSITL
jgi:RimJ/RimL family protein N-acetyltransferase